MIPAPYPPPPADDTCDGLAMLLVFIVAVLTVTGAVAALAVIGTWWMLGLVVGVHAIATVVVGLTIVWVMTGRPEAMRSRASSAPEDEARAVARRSRGVSRPRRGEPHVQPQSDRSEVQAAGGSATTTGRQVPRLDVGRIHQSTHSVEPLKPSSSIREPYPGIKRHEL
jgi:hypothetical protein